MRSGKYLCGIHGIKSLMYLNFKKSRPLANYKNQASFNSMEKLKYERPFVRKLNSGLMNKFGTRTEYTPYTHIDGVSVTQLIQKYGSPCFVISERTIRKTYQNAVRAFKTRYPKVQFAWSYKTNYIDAICNVFHQEGSWAEVVSIFEYTKAISNGVPGIKLFSTDQKKAKMT
jgi:diaminopimelate decarboxylase